MNRIALAVCLSLVTTTCNADEPINDANAITGTWIVSSSEKGGPNAPVGETPSLRPGDKLVFTKPKGGVQHHYIIRSVGPRSLVDECRLKPDESPKQLDLVINEENVRRCIYKLGKEELVICMGNMERHDESDRPTSLKASRKCELVVAKRVAEK